MNDLGDLVFDEQWDKVLKAISKNKNLIEIIDPKYINSV